MGGCKEIQEVSWTKLQGNAAMLLPKIPNNTNLQLEPDTNHSSTSIPDEDIPDKARDKLKELLNIKYSNAMSQTAMDIVRTNLIELDILAEGPIIVSKPYMVPLKYCKFMDHNIKQLEEVGIISRSMSDWFSPMLVFPKKEEWLDANYSANNNNNWKFNFMLCIAYRKLNSRIQTVCQIKADGSLGKVILNYLLPPIDSILACFNGCKFFSTIDLRSGYYHIRLSKDSEDSLCNQ